MQTTRRDFLKTMSGASAAVMVAPGVFRKLTPRGPVFFQAAGSGLAGGDIPKYVTELVKPPAMPRSGGGGRKRRSTKYDIAVRQFEQQILPTPYGTTTVWSYGSVDHPGHVTEGGSFFYPAFTMEVNANEKVTVRWINDLVDANGTFLPHLLPVDQTLHWANPPGGKHMRDHRGDSGDPYTGPVPIVTHVHGAHVSEESDGYAEAWFLPNANDIPTEYARTGTFFDYFNLKYGLGWDKNPGEVVYTYTNDQPAATLWYHDHTLGMTRVNVYAGPAGFWIIRKGGFDADLGFVAPVEGDSPFGEYTEIPIAIQDRSFKPDGSLFYPDNRAFFEDLSPAELDIPFLPEWFDDGSGTCVKSDVSPIWNPEFFGDVMVVNGRSWPYLEVNQQRYRFRLLNGCNSRFLVLDFSELVTAGAKVWQIGAEQGFLPSPYDVAAAGGTLLMAPAERADVIVDFGAVDEGNYLLGNLGPDEPFGGGEVDTDFDRADPSTTGQVMQFQVRANSAPAVDPGFDPGTWDPAAPMWVAAPALGPAVNTRTLSLNELESETVTVTETDGVTSYDPNGAPFGPTEARLGTYDLATGVSSQLRWSDVITEVVAQVGDTEIWEIYNFTADAHPMHLHLVKFEVVNRQDLSDLTDGQASPGATPTGSPSPPEPWETGFKDTVIAYPGQVTRVKATFDLPGFYVWHCHIVEHEDNEMMRPFHVGPIPLDAPAL